MDKHQCRIARWHVWRIPVWLNLSITSRTCHHNKKHNNYLFRNFIFICTLLCSKAPKRPTSFPALLCYERTRLERIGFQERCACNKVSKYDKNYDILNYRYTEIKTLTYIVPQDRTKISWKSQETILHVMWNYIEVIFTCNFSFHNIL